MRRLGMVNETYSHPIKLSDSHLLGALQSDPNRRARDLSRILNIEKSVLSRMITTLTAKGLIKISISSDDAREKRLGLTTQGEKALEKVRRAGNELFERWAERISSDEERELDAFFGKLADGFGAERDEHRPGDALLRSNMRRVARHIGVLGEAVSGKRIGATQKHVLFVLSAAASDQSVTASALSTELNLDPSTLSRVLAQMRKMKLLESRPGTLDRRSQILSLTPDGRRTVSALEEEARGRIKEALGGTPHGEINRAMDIFQRFFEGASTDDKIQSGKLEVKCLKDDQQRTVARTFLIEQYFRKGLHSKLPSRLFSDDGISIGAFQDQRLIGVCELQPYGNAWIMENFWLKSDTQSQQTGERIVEYCREVIRKRSRVAILVPKNGAAAGYALRLGAKSANKDFLRI